MSEKKKISPELNRARVKAAQENMDRINIYFPKGTAERMDELGIPKKSTFIKDVVLAEIGKLEKFKKNEN